MPDGLRVRLRLARSGDQRPMADLLARLGFEPSTGQLQELVRFDPRQRAVVCATALVDGGEHVIGFGLIDLDAPRSPASVVSDPVHGRALTRLIREALDARVRPLVEA